MDSRIHAIICDNYYAEERTTPRECHRYDFMRTMEVGQTVKKYIRRKSWCSYRSTASRLGKLYGVGFSLHFDCGELTITRTK